MKVFVSEFLVGGASAGADVPASMRREGLAMLQSVTEDIARLTGWSPLTTIENGLSVSLAGEVIRVSDANHEAAVFRDLLGKVDAVLVIAPETDGQLAERCQLVRQSGTASWNCSPTAIELCGDKFQLAEHLRANGLPTIPTRLVDPQCADFDESDPQVLKPRDGAGSCLTFLIRDRTEWENAARSFHEAGLAHKCIAQPFVPGKALSVGVIISLDGRRIECLPVAEQRLSDDGRFRYLGGLIPAVISRQAQDSIEEIVHRMCCVIPGLAGYVGVDLLLVNDTKPVIVEVNPRLTTSYAGYRYLFATTLAERWLTSDDSRLSFPSNQPVSFEVANSGIDVRFHQGALANEWSPRPGFAGRG